MASKVVLSSQWYQPRPLPIRIVQSAIQPCRSSSTSQSSPLVAALSLWHLFFSLFWLTQVSLSPMMPDSVLFLLMLPFCRLKTTSKADFCVRAVDRLSVCHCCDRTLPAHGLVNKPTWRDFTNDAHGFTGCASGAVFLRGHRSRLKCTSFCINRRESNKWQKV